MTAMAGPDPREGSAPAGAPSRADPEPREFRYTGRALRGDYAKAGIGLAITVPPLAIAEPGPVAMAVLGTLALLFAYLGIRNLRRQASRFLLSEAGLRRGRDGIAWRELERLRLRHFGSRKGAPGSGWMELRLAAGGARITVDSELDGFLAIARAAHGAALDRRLVLDAATRANFRALGLPVPESDADAAPPA